MINIGPTKEGTIAPIFEERLRQLGKWLSTNGEAIYGSKPWKYQNDTKNSNVWYTKKSSSVYAILLKYPQDLKVELAAPVVTSSTQVTMLGYNTLIQWVSAPTGTGIILDLTPVNKLDLPSEWAWVFKLQDIQ